MNCIPNMCEGNKTILDIAIQTELPFRFVEKLSPSFEKKEEKRWQGL